MNTNHGKKQRSWYPPIWLTILITLLILTSIFVPYHQRLNHEMRPILNAIKAIPTQSSQQNER